MDTTALGVGAFYDALWSPGASCTLSSSGEDVIVYQWVQ